MSKINYPPYPKYKSSGIDWLGKIPEDWEIKKLKYLFENQKGGVWGNESREDQNDLVCFRVADFDFYNFSLNKNDLTIRNIPEKYQDKILTKGDILLEKSGGGEKQLVGRAVRFDLNIRAVCSNFIEQLILQKKCNSKYFTYLMGALYFNNINYRSIKQTTGIQNLDIYSYLSEIAPLPKIETQELIANFLDHETEKIDQIIEKNNRQIELLKEKRQAVITRSVTKGLNPRARLKSSGIDWLGDIPEGWKILPFTKYLKEKSDYRGATPEKVENGIFLVTAKNIRMGFIDYEISQEFVRESEYQHIMNRGLPKLGDILFTTEAPLGNIALVDKENIALAQRIIRFRMLPDFFDGKFTFYSMIAKYFQDQLMSLSTGSTAEGLKASKLNLLYLICPKVKEQEEIVKYLDLMTGKIDEAVKKLQLKNEKLPEYKQALISSAITGKIRV